MSKLLRVLLIDDHEPDAALVVRELLRAGYDVESLRVDTPRTLIEALEARAWDLVVSADVLAALDAAKALELIRSKHLDLPFIVVSPSALAVSETHRADAHPVPRDDLARLLPAVDRALREHAEREAQRRMEEARRLSFTALVEASPELTVVHMDGRVVYANPAAVHRLARPGRSLIGMGVLDLVHADEHSLAVECMGRAWKGLEATRYEARWLTCDGLEVPVEVSHRALVFNGKPAMASIAHDLTAQKRVQSQLLVSDRMASVGILAAGVAHEINNPLAAVLANLELASRDLQRVAEDLGPHEALSELGESLRDAREAADRVRLIVRDLKIFSRGEDDNAKSVDIQKIIESSLRMAWNEIRHRATLVKDYGEVPLVAGTEARLGQVFLNLIVNAAQAMPEGRAKKNQIRVSTGVDASGRVAVEVSDTGVGMSPEVLSRLFTPFFTTKPTGVGTGLGLSICQRIVHGFGGEIQVESTLGRGSTFRVLLKAASESAAQLGGADGLPPLPAPDHRRGRVLVVDDEPTVGRIVERSVGREHEVVIVQSARTALEHLLGEESYDVLLVDLMMPDMTGMEFYERLVDLENPHAERIIFMSGGAFTPAARRFLDVTPNQRIEKPFDLHHLVSLVNDRIR